MARERRGNDLDLLVVFDDAQYHSTKTESLLQVSLAKFHRKFDIEPFTLPISKYLTLLQSGEPFLSAITREGRVLYMVNYVNEWLRQSDEGNRMVMMPNVR